MRILLIGTGRVAKALGHALVKAGIPISGVAGREPLRTAALAHALGTSAFQLSDELPASDVILIAISDDAIAPVSEKIQDNGAVVVHTSGASSIDVLATHAARGVLWPVQTFIADKQIDLKEVPMVIEGSSEHARHTIHELASLLSDRVIELQHEARERLHLAAVFTSNFAVILLIEAAHLLQRSGLPTDLLMPLWRTTSENVIQMGARDSLTGPATRKDLRTIQRHLSLLNNDPELRRLYALMTERVLR